MLRRVRELTDLREGRHVMLQLDDQRAELRVVAAAFEFVPVRDVEQEHRGCVS